MRVFISSRIFKHTFAVVLALVMVFPLISLASAADAQLATPILIPKGDPSVLADETPGNPAKHTQFRSLVFKPIVGATGYNVYAYATKSDAEADTNPLAFAENVSPTIGSGSLGGTQGTSTISLADNECLIDVRLIEFIEIKENTTRTLPAGYTPAGLGDSYFPGDGAGDKTNLRPGQYWFRLQAVDADNPARNSDLSAIYADGDAFSISMGPDEARDILEAFLVNGNPSNTSESPLRIIDLRNAAELSDEGYIKFSEGNRMPASAFNTTEEAEAIFGHVNDKSAVTIFVLCRGGGRAVTAARHLSNAGYTNVYNLEGVNQWTLGLMYDDPTFRFRQASSGNDGDLGPSTTTASPAGISYDAEAGVIRWYNIPRARFNIYAFASETQADALAIGTLPVLAQDLTGNGADWRLVRSFDLSELNLGEGTYYIRVQALPDTEEAVRGYTPAANWGAPSELSDPIEVTVQVPPHGKGTFTDVTPSDWFYTAAKYAFENNLFAGISDTEFGPDININGIMFLTVLYRMEGSPVVVDTSGVPISYRTSYTKDNNPYYAYALTWANENGIIEDLVGHDNDISRIRLAMYLYRYATYKGFMVRNRADLSKYIDIDGIHAHVLVPLQWANAEGFILGHSETTLAPYENTTRAEAAAILMRFSERFVK